ncbi:MAG: DUF4968 domain-containing protein, partial [Muribaculaceae bacterium]|nr:DUF4968 domain-containing protein [Muribaculaceae bacterium]
MRKSTTLLLLASLSLSASALTKEEGKVIVPVGEGVVTLDWYGEGIVRVTKTPDGKSLDRNSLAITATPSPSKKMKVAETSDKVTVSTPKLKVTVDKADGKVSYSTAKDDKIVEESGNAVFTPFDDAGRKSWTVTQGFALEPEEDI